MHDFLKSLRDPKEKNRLNAVMTLAKRGLPESLPVLLKISSSDPSTRVRRQAVAAAEALSRHLEGREEPETRNLSLAAFLEMSLSAKLSLVDHLGRPDDRETSRFLKEVVLTDENPLVTRKALAAIGSAGDRTDIPFIATFLSDRNPRVVKTAIEALRLIGDPSGLLLLVNAAWPDHYLVEHAISKFMSDFSAEQVCGLLRRRITGSTQIAKLAVIGFMNAFFRQEFIPLLIELSQDPAAVVADKALSLLEEMKSSIDMLSDAKRSGSSVEGLLDPFGMLSHDLVAGLKSSSSSRRTEALQLIVENSISPACARRLAAMLEAEEDPDVLIHLIPASLIAGRDLSIKRIEKLSKHPSPDVRCCVAESLGRLPADSGIREILLELLKDQDTQVVSRAANSINVSFPVMADEAIRTLLQDRGPNGRCAAVDIIFGKGPAADLSILTRLADDEDREVRSRAVTALRTLALSGNSEARSIIENRPQKPGDEEMAIRLIVEEWDTVKSTMDESRINYETAMFELESQIESNRINAIRELEDIGDDRTLEAFQLATRDPSRAVRFRAARSFIKLKRRLTESRATLDSSSPVQNEWLADQLNCPSREARIRALKTVGPSDTHLLHCLLGHLAREGDSRVKPLLLSVIGMIGGDAVSDRIFPFLDDPDPRVRANAVDAIRFVGDQKVVHRVLPLLQDPNQRVQTNVVCAIQDLDPAASANLITEMSSSPDRKARMSAAYVMGIVGRRDTLVFTNLLKTMLSRENDPLVFLRIVRSLVKIYKNYPEGIGVAVLESLKSRYALLSADEAGPVAAESKSLRQAKCKVMNWGIERLKGSTAPAVELDLGDEGTEQERNILYSTIRVLPKETSTGLPASDPNENLELLTKSSIRRGLGSNDPIERKAAMGALDLLEKLTEHEISVLNDIARADADVTLRYLAKRALRKHGLGPAIGTAERVNPKTNPLPDIENRGKLASPDKNEPSISVTNAIFFSGRTAMAYSTSDDSDEDGTIASMDDDDLADDTESSPDKMPKPAIPSLAEIDKTIMGKFALVPESGRVDNRPPEGVPMQSESGQPELKEIPRILVDDFSGDEIELVVNELVREIENGSLRAVAHARTELIALDHPMVDSLLSRRAAGTTRDSRRVLKGVIHARQAAKSGKSDSSAAGSRGKRKSPDKKSSVPIGMAVILNFVKRLLKTAAFIALAVGLAWFCYENRGRILSGYSWAVKKFSREPTSSPELFKALDQFFKGRYADSAASLKGVSLPSDEEQLTFLKIFETLPTLECFGPKSVEPFSSQRFGQAGSSESAVRVQTPIDDLSAGISLIVSENFEEAARRMRTYVEQTDRLANDSSHGGKAWRLLSPALRLTLAWALYKCGDIKSAQANTARCLDDRPDFHAALILSGILHIDSEHPVNAVPSLNRALALNPEDCYALALLGHALILSDKYDEGLMAVDRAMEGVKGPASRGSVAFEILCRCGEAKIAAKRIEEGLDLYRRALAIKPNARKARQKYACLLGNFGYSDQSVKEFKALVEAFPSDPVLMAGLGDAYLNYGLYGEAFDTYQAALPLSNDMAPLVYRMALVKFWENETDEAAALFERVLSIAPDMTEAHFSLASIRHQEGNAAEATKHYFEVLRTDPSHPVARARLLELGVAEESISRPPARN